MKTVAISIMLLASQLSCHRSSVNPHPPPPAAVQSAFSTSPESSPLGMTSDSVLTFIRHSRSFSVSVSSEFVALLSAFQTFLNDHPSDSLNYRNLELVDVTGDGVPDSCITTISLVGGVPFVEHSIKSMSRMIWYDSLSYPGFCAPSYGWEDSAAYQALKPHSAFFLAEHADSTFVKSMVDTASSEFSYFTTVLHAGNRSDWVKRYSSFKGHWIMKLDLSDPHGMVWDAQSERFITYTGN